MKDILAILWMRVQIFFYESLRCIPEFIGKVFDCISKFMYLYLMDSYKRTDFRNFVASKVRKLKQKDDPDMELVVRKCSELYQWMCDNQ